jgi:hypothetical protein
MEESKEPKQMSIFNYAEDSDNSAIYIFDPRNFWQGEWRYNTFDLRMAVKNAPDLQYFSRPEYRKYCGLVPRDGNAKGLLSTIKLAH